MYYYVKIFIPLRPIYNIYQPEKFIKKIKIYQPENWEACEILYHFHGCISMKHRHLFGGHLPLVDMCRTRGRMWQVEDTCCVMCRVVCPCFLCTYTITFGLKSLPLSVFIIMFCLHLRGIMLYSCIDLSICSCSLACWISIKNLAKNWWTFGFCFVGCLHYLKNFDLSYFLLFLYF